MHIVAAGVDSSGIPWQRGIYRVMAADVSKRGIYIVTGFWYI